MADKAPVGAAPKQDRQAFDWAAYDGVVRMHEDLLMEEAIEAQREVQG